MSNRYTQWLENLKNLQPFFAQSTILPKNMRDMISGAPYYIEASASNHGEKYTVYGEVGGFLSDHGSVSGLKCGASHTINDIYFDRVHPLHVAFYSAFRLGKKTDRFIINVISQRRRITYYPWGWEETSRLPNGLLLSAKVFTHQDRDRHVMLIDLSNPTEHVITCEIPFCLSLSHVEDHEGMVDFRELEFSHHLRKLTPHTIIYSYQSGKSQIGREHFFRCLYCTQPFSVRPTDKTFKSPHALFGTLDSHLLHPQEHVMFSFHVITKRTQKQLEEAMGSLGDKKQSHHSIQEDIEVFHKTHALWTKRFDMCPPLPYKNPIFTHVYGLALTHAMMNLRPPSSKGPPLWSSSPSRGHFDQHWGWDTPYQAWTYSLIMPRIAFDHLLLQNAIMEKFGYLPYWTPVDLHPKQLITRWGLRILGISMPPVQGEVIRNLIYAQEPEKDGWMDEFHNLLLEQVDFWASRGKGKSPDTLQWWKAPLESGWDDTPTLTFATQKKEVVPFYSMAFSRLMFHEYIRYRPNTYHVDASVFYWDLLISLWWFRNKFPELKKKELPYSLTEVIASVRKKINETFWNEKDGIYYNINSGKHLKIKTPIGFWPLAFGAVDSYDKAKSVIENHILNPDIFWGSQGIPTVAFSEKKYFNEKHRGYYWRGAIWPLVNFYAARSLSAHGYEQEAGELISRLCTLMVSADPGGLHENYDPLLPRVGFGCGTGKGGIGEPSAFGQGFTNLTAFLLLLRFHDHLKFVFDVPECRNNTSLKGFIHHVFQDKDRAWHRILKIHPEKFPSLPESRISPANPKHTICSDTHLICHLSNPYDQPIEGQIEVGENAYPYTIAPGSSQEIKIAK